MRLIDADALKKDIDTEWLTPQTKMAFNKIIDDAPTVSEITKEKLAIAYDQGYEDGKTNWNQYADIPKGEFTRRELESWLYAIAINNTKNELGSSCEEIISRLDGFERFVSDMRKGDISCE